MKVSSMDGKGSTLWREAAESACTTVAGWGVAADLRDVVPRTGGARAWPQRGRCRVPCLQQEAGDPRGRVGVVEAVVYEILRIGATARA